MTILPAKLIQSVEGMTLVSDFAHENIVAAMTTRGYAFLGLTTSKSLRAELQGQPKFRGVAGPMWGGDHQRYECAETTRTVTQ